MEEPYGHDPQAHAAWLALKGDKSIDELAHLNQVDPQTIEAWRDDFARAVAHEALFGFHETSLYKQLVYLGDELEKMAWFAGDCNFEDKQMAGLAAVCVSTYYAGIVPIIKVEGGIYFADRMRNELVQFSLLRLYAEFAGRIHKGTRLVRNFDKKKYAPEKFAELTERLLKKYGTDGVDEGAEPNGFNVMAMIDSIIDKIENIKEFYDDLSTYLHGNFISHHFIGQVMAKFRGEPKQGPLWSRYQRDLDVLKRMREMVVEDCEFLIERTAPWREKVDQMRTMELLKQAFMPVMKQKQDK